MKIRPLGAELFHADGRTVRHDDADCRLRKRPETYYLNQVKNFFSKNLGTTSKFYAPKGWCEACSGL